MSDVNKLFIVTLSQIELWPELDPSVIKIKERDVLEKSVEESKPIQIDMKVLMTLQMYLKWSCVIWNDLTGFQFNELCAAVYLVWNALIFL